MQFDADGILDPRSPAVSRVEDAFSLDDIVEAIAALDPLGRSTIRVRLPDSSPEHAVQTVRRVLLPLRAPAEERSFRRARFVVIDGWDASAIGWGDAVDDAISEWQAALFRTKPRPPREGVREPPTSPAPADVPAPPGAFTVTFGGSGEPAVWPAATPRNVPAVLHEVPSLDREIPAALRSLGFSRWAHVVGERVGVARALVRDERDGRTVLGEDAIERVEPGRLATIDRQMAERRAEHRRFFEHRGEEWLGDALGEIAMFDVKDDGNVAWSGGQYRADLGPADLDGDVVVGRVARLRV